jgi:TetR/AcrR family transcriptional repressor of nem operon
MTVDTKTALLNSAERAARTRGFDGFSYADLATDVGIRKASIHHHFPTKAVLSSALMQRYHEDFIAALDEIDAHEATGAARLSALIDRYRTALNDGTSLCLCVSFSASRESLSPEVIALISRFRSTVIGWIEQSFADGAADGSILAVLNPAAEATAAMAMLEGGQLAARAEQTTKMFDDAVALLTARLHL